MAVIHATWTEVRSFMYVVLTLSKMFIAQYRSTIFSLYNFRTTSHLNSRCTIIVLSVFFFNCRTYQKAIIIQTRAHRSDKLPKGCLFHAVKYWDVHFHRQKWREGQQIVLCSPKKEKDSAHDNMFRCVVVEHRCVSKQHAGVMCSNLAPLFFSRYLVLYLWSSTLVLQCEPFMYDLNC